MRMRWRYLEYSAPEHQVTSTAAPLARLLYSIRDAISITTLLSLFRPSSSSHSFPFLFPSAWALYRLSVSRICPRQSASPVAETQGSALVSARASSQAHLSRLASSIVCRSPCRPSVGLAPAVHYRRPSPRLLLVDPGSLVD